MTCEQLGSCSWNRMYLIPSYITYELSLVYVTQGYIYNYSCNCIQIADIHLCGTVGVQSDPLEEVHVSVGLFFSWLSKQLILLLMVAMVFCASENSFVNNCLISPHRCKDYYMLSDYLHKWNICIHTTTNSGIK